MFALEKGLFLLDRFSRNGLREGLEVFMDSLAV